MAEIARLECDSCGKQVDAESADGWLSVGTIQAHRHTEFTKYVSGQLCSLICLELFAATAKPVEVAEESRVVRNDGTAHLLERLGLRESELRSDLKPPGQYL